MKKLYTMIAVLSCLLTAQAWAEDTVMMSESMPTALSTTTSEPSSVTPAAIDCNYSFSGPASDISSETIIQWANHAVVQTFSYDFQNYDQQFQELKRCYTSTGWDSFTEAMKLSNNLKATQEEHLFVSSAINGQSQLSSQRVDDQQAVWVVRIPLKVTYQNQDREVSQDMYVDVTMKTIYGVPTRLGINQIISSPKTDAPTVPGNLPAQQQSVAATTAPTTNDAAVNALNNSMNNSNSAMNGQTQ